jgi:hypothetical protein
VPLRATDENQGAWRISFRVALSACWARPTVSWLSRREIGALWGVLRLSGAGSRVIGRGESALEGVPGRPVLPGGSVCGILLVGAGD